MHKSDPSRPASLDDGTPTRVRRAFLTVALALFLGSVLTAPAVADEEGTGDAAFDKFAEWNAALRDYEDAADQASAAKDALDAATRARDEASSKVEEARRNLDSRLDAERSLPPGSSRTERLQARSDVDAARNAANSAQSELDDANAALEEAEQAHREAEAEAEALRAKAERLNREFQELKAQQDEALASEGSDSEGGDSAIGSGAPPPDPEIAGTGPQGGGTAGADGGVDPGLSELVQRSSSALAEARNALEAMAAALNACDAEAFVAARQRVQGALGVLAQTADLAFLDLSAAIASSGAGDPRLPDLAAAAHAAMNQIAGAWKSMEQLWAERCGAGAVCAAPPAAAAGGFPAGGGGSAAPPHRPAPLDPRPRDPDTPDPSAGGGGPRPPRPPAGGGSPGGGGGRPAQGTAGGTSAGKGGAPPCPDTPELAYYRSWLADIEQQIAEREAALEDPGAGDATRSTAADQLGESLYPTRAYLERQLSEESAKACARAAALAADEAEQGARLQAQLAAPSPGEEFDRNMLIRQLQNLKNAADELQTRAQQMQESLEALQGRIGAIDAEIAELQASGGGEDRIRELTQVRNGLARNLQSRQQAYRAELAQLVAVYQLHLWIVSPQAFAQSEIERIVEYKNLRDELVRTQEARQVSDAAFQQAFDEMATAIAEAERAGNTALAEQLRQQLTNMRAGKQDWDRYSTSKEARLAREVGNLEIRNGLDGVGPGIYGDTAFVELWNKYGFEGDPFGAVMTDDDKAYLTQKILEYADGARGRQPDDDRAFVVRFAEEIGREFVRNLDPRVQVAKARAFALGTVEGTTEGVVGFARLVLGAGDVVLESGALLFGFDDGGIFGTDALETLNGVLGQATPGGLVDATIAAGKVIDDTLMQIQRSSDPGVAGARLGGRIFGNLVVADAALAPVVSRGAQATQGMVTGIATRVEDGIALIRGVDRTTDAARAASAAATTADAVADAARAAAAAETGTASASTGARRGASQTAPVTTRVPDGAPFDPSPTHKPNSDLSFVNGAGEQVSVQTGPRLGKPGSGSTAYLHGEDATKVVRVTKKGGMEGASELDEFGRRAVEEVQTQTDAIRVADRYEIHDIDPSQGADFTKVEVNERLMQGTAGDVIAGQGGQMTSGQARAFDRATRELNDRGYAWLDNHKGNYTFERLPGEDNWRVVVIDPGGIVPMKAGNGRTAAQNARSVQGRINDPDPEFVEAVNLVGDTHLRDHFAFDQFNSIRDEFKDLFDLDALGVNSIDAIKFRPDGVVNYPEIGQLFRGSADQLTDAARGAAGAGPAGAGGASAPGISVGAATRSSSAGAPTTSGGARASQTSGTGRAGVSVPDLQVPMTGAGVAGGAYNLLTGGVGQGPFSAMTNPSLMCWSRLYVPIVTPFGMWVIPFDTYDPAFFERASQTNSRVLFVEQNKEFEPQGTRAERGDERFVTAAGPAARRRRVRPRTRPRRHGQGPVSRSRVAQRGMGAA
jgi:hypothetical protein